MRYENCGRPGPDFKREEAIFRKIGKSLTGCQIYIGHGCFRPLQPTDPDPLILSHYTPVKNDPIKNDSYWTSAAWVRPEDFGLLHGVTGSGRKWRASILVHPDIDMMDDHVHWHDTKDVRVREYKLTVPIGGPDVAWLSTGWVSRTRSGWETLTATISRLRSWLNSYRPRP